MKFDLFDQKPPLTVKDLLADEFLNEDGMIYCKKCVKPRTTLLKGWEGQPDKIVRCVCECGKIAQEEERRKQEALERQKLYEDLRTASLIGERYKTASFDTIDLNRDKSFVTAVTRCKKYCESADEVLSRGLGIYIVGGFGVGKSHLMACMVNELLEQYRPCLFTNFFEIAKALKRTYNRSLYSESEVMNKFTSIDFLFIDDIGTERVQKEGEDTWLQEKLYEVINSRYNDKKPTVFSSNLKIAELSAQRGIMTKTIDRIHEMSSAIIEINDVSYRFKAKEKDLPF